MEKCVKSGRGMLRKLLPAFFFLFFSDYSFSVPLPYPVIYSSDSSQSVSWKSTFPYSYSVSLLPDSSADVSVGQFQNKGCWLALDFDYHWSYRKVGRHYGCNTLGDALRLCQQMRSFIPGDYIVGFNCLFHSIGAPNIPGFGVPPSLVGFSGQGVELYALHIVNNLFADGVEMFFWPKSNSMLLTSEFDFNFGNGALLCINGCKADLAAKKSAIQAEGATVLTGITGSPGTTLPCFGIFCLTGKETELQPIANTVLLIGSLGSAFIVFRKKPKKGRERNK